LEAAGHRARRLSIKAAARRRHKHVGDVVKVAATRRYSSDLIGCSANALAALRSRPQSLRVALRGTRLIEHDVQTTAATIKIAGKVPSI
jgi:hypothetical protein